MGQEIYTALSGAYTSLRQLEVVSNNIANASTTGYKSQRLAHESSGPEGAYARISEGIYDMSNGPVRHTNTPTDVAIQGEGWLAVQDGSGTLLTRDGRLRMDADGTLVAPGGQPVLGAQGIIMVPPGETVSIDADGVVMGSTTGVLDKLRLVVAAAEPVGDNLWRPTGELTTAPNAQLVPGALESSNVDPMKAMVELIEAGRNFEAFQKAMQASDELDARLNEVGRS